MNPTTTWLSRLSRLRVDRARGQPAPHKPLLLLTLLQQADETGAFPPAVALTPELAFRFLALGTVVAHRQSQRLDIRLPFHHLRSDGVWTATDREGQPATDFRRVSVACVDPEFAKFVSEPQNRLNAMRVLIRDYFQPAEQVGLRELLNLTADETEPTDANGSPLVIEEAVRQGREARFRLRVVAAYNYTCALTGFRLTTVTGATVVDAAHIHQFADSRNNDLRNGLALSKTAHWLFDQGLWSLTDDCRVLVASEHFTESGPDAIRLTGYADRTLLSPGDHAVTPNPEYIRWHRENRFEG